MLIVVKLMTSFQTNCFGFVLTLSSPIAIYSYFVQAPPFPHPLSYSPCIMCAQYRGVLSTMGVFSTVGDIMSTVGDILSTVEGILSTVGDILSTMGFS